MQTIGVIGAGFVGSAIVRGFNQFYGVKVYDIDPKKRTHSLEETMQSEFVFVCLPTPMIASEGGCCDLSYYQNFFAEISNIPTNAIIIIKSTVPIGTTGQFSQFFPKLTIVHSPEFLTARTAYLDFICPARNIVGGENPEAVEKVAKLYQDRFPGIVCYTMSSLESEFVKYFNNCFLATKVLFFNEMKLLSDKMNINWERLLEGVLSDGRISKTHYQVPGHDGQKGVGGTCFPKDINSLINIFESYELDPKILRAVWEQNKAIREDWDWGRNKSAVTQSIKDKHG
jgi:UDPglucose 6-dehydrogenase